MPENKKYLIEIEGVEGQMVKDADWWERNKDIVYERAPKAKVFEIADYDENDRKESDQYLLGVPGVEGADLWDSQRWERNKDKMPSLHPDATVKRVRYVDYWGDQRDAMDARKGEIEKRLQAMRDEDSSHLHAPSSAAPIESEFVAPASSTAVAGGPATRPQKKHLGLLDQQARLMENPEYAALWEEKNKIDEAYEKNPYVVAQRAAEKEYQDNYLSYLEADVRKNMEAEVGNVEYKPHEYLTEAVRLYMPISAKAMDLSNDIFRGKDAYDTDPEKATNYADALTYIDMSKKLREEEHTGFFSAMKDVEESMFKMPLTREAGTAITIWKMLDKMEEKYGDLNNLDADKIEESLSNDEKALLLSYFEYNNALQDAEHSKDILYKAGEIAGRSVPFMVEFIVTGGVASAAKGGVKAGAKGLMSWLTKKMGRKAGAKATRWMVSNLGKNATRAIMDVVPVALSEVARTAAQPTTYMEMLKSLPEIGEDGHLHAGANAVKAFSDKVIENFSESSGELLLGVFGKAKGGIPHGKTRQFFNNLGFQGLPAEIFEEIEGAAIREMTGVDEQALDQMFEPDNLAAMVIGFAPMQLVGAGSSAVSMGVAKRNLVKSTDLMRKDLGEAFSASQLAHVEKVVSAAETPNAVVAAVRPFVAALEANGYSDKIPSLMNYAKSVAAYRSMFSAETEEQTAEREAMFKRLEENRGQFWMEGEGGRKVRQVVMKDGKVLYSTAPANENGEFTYVGPDGKVHFAKESDIADKIDKDGKVVTDQNGNAVKNEVVVGIDKFLDFQILADKKRAERDRMQQERNAQIDALKGKLAETNGEINIGTVENPEIVFAQSQTQDGVVAINENGDSINLTWEQVGSHLGAPIEVMTDAQKTEQEINDYVRKIEEREAKRKGEVEAKAQEKKAAEENPAAAYMLPDGSVDEAAFWNNDPEAYVKWNDGQRNDNGRDSFKQLLAASRLLEQELAQVQKTAETTDPILRRTAESNIAALADRKARVDALIQEYADRFITSEEARKKTEKEIIAKAQELSELTGVKINIITNKAQVPDEVVRQQIEQGALMAFATLGTEKAEAQAYIYLPAISSVQMMEEKFVHEVVTHIGMRKLLGNEAYDKFCGQVWQMMSAEAKRHFLAYPNTNGNPLVAADEYIAHLAEKMGSMVFNLDSFNMEEAKAQLTSEEASTWEKIWQAAKEFFASVFGKAAEVLQEVDIFNAIRYSYANLVKMQERKVAAKNAIATLSQNLTPEQLEAVVANDVAAAQQAYDDVVAQAPKVEPGETSDSFLGRQEKYKEAIAKAQANLDAKKDIADMLKAQKEQDKSKESGAIESKESEQSQAILDKNGNPEVEVTPNRNLRASSATFKTWTDNLGNEHEGTETMVLARMKKMGFTEDEILGMQVKMNEAYEYMEKLRSLTNPDGSVRFEEFNTWAEKTPLYKQVGRDFVKAITSLVSNGDYPINLELTTDCIKREAFTQLLNVLVKRGADLTEMGPGNIVTIQNIMKQYGIQVACKLCFVEGKRLQIINWASQIVDDWNAALVEAGVQTDEYFEFGKDGDEFIPAEEWRTYENKSKLNKFKRSLDDVVLLFQGIDPKTFKNQRAKNNRRLKAYEKEMSEKWAIKNKKPASAWVPNDDQKREMKKIKNEGLAPVYVNENMKEYKAAFEALRNEWLDKNPGKDPLSFNPTKKQWEKLDKIRNRQIDNVKAKMVRLIMEFPEMRKKMTMNDLLGSKGLMEIRQQHGVAYEQLYSIILQRFGTGTPKPVQDAVPYDGEVMTLSESAFKEANKIGGARLFSFSDFDITKVFDYMQMFFDLEANKQMLQSYTKEVAAVLLFGRSNAKFNISTLAEAVVPQEVLDEFKTASEGKQKELRHKWAENAGLEIDEDGNIVGITFSEEHSVSPDFARQIFHDDSRNKDCGAIMVGCSVNHAIFSAAQDWIRMVIPFHLSGMPAAARAKTDVNWWTDNTAYQSTRKRTKDGWSKIDKGEDTFEFYADMHEPGWNMRDKAREYIEWCKKNGFRPKFDWGINSDYYRAYCEEQGYTPNQQIIDMMDAQTTDGVWDQYYKFLTDFTAYKPVFNEAGEMIDEIPSPQQRVVANFDFSDMEREVIFEGEDSMLGRRENNMVLADTHMNEMAGLVEQYLSGEITEEQMGLRDDVFFDSKQDADAYLDALAGDLRMSTSKGEPQGEELRYSLIKEVNKKFNKRLAELEADPTQKDRILHLGRPSVFLMRGGIRDAEILLEYDKFVRKSAKSYKSNHPFTAADIENLPLAIYAPIASFDSSNGTEQVILTELKKDGNNFVVIVRATRHPRKGGAILEVNDIQTLYPKNAKGIINWIITGKTTQVDTEKALDWIGALQTHLGTELSQQELSYAAKVIKEFKNPNLMISEEQDKAYMNAVEDGDMETAQRMVIEAAKLAMPNTKVVDEDGNPKVVYHQTNAKIYVNRETGQNWDELDWKEKMVWDERDDWEDYWEEQDFNTFSRVNARTTNEFDGFFFAPKYDEYHEYGERTIAVFVNIQNPAYNKDYNIDSTYSDAGRNERIRLQEDGFDGVIRMDGEEVDEYIAFESSQIKSADPVTYDDAGNVIPLSERFNPENADIRFSVVAHESSMDEVDSMFKQYNGDPFVRDLYGKVSELAHTMGLKISFAEGLGRRSGLNVLDKIKYNVDYFNSPDVYAQDKAKTLLHELIHSVTRYAIYAKDAEFMSPRLKEAVAQLESIYEEIKNDPAFEGMYGVTNVEEMVSELANVRFRAKLREKNLLQKIVDAIKNLLGIDKGDKALDNLSATLEDMIFNFDRAAYEQVRTDVSKQDNYIRFSVKPEVRAEMDGILANAMVDGLFERDADGMHMLAPNGKRSNLDMDRWALVRTKNFKEWFGDWENDPENASKVVDENGEPKVVYHGTNWNPYEESAGNAHFVSGWFTGMKRRAEGYGEPVAVFLNLRNPAFSYDAGKGENSVLPDTFDLNKPSTFGEYDGYVSYTDYPAEASLSKIVEMRIKMLHPDNYEEVIKETLASMPTGRQIFSAIPRYPNQIKSIHNNGEFSESGDIRFSVSNVEKKRVALQETEPVSVAENTIVASDGESGRKAAMKWYDENIGKELSYNTEIGNVTINRRSIKNSLAHGYSQTKLDAIASLPNGFGRAVYITSEPDYDGKPEDNHYFVYPITYKGDIQYVFCRAKSDVNKTSLYIHEVFPIDAIKGHTLQTAADQSQPHRGMSLYLDLLKEVLYGKGTNNFDTASESEEKVDASAITQEEIEIGEGDFRASVVTDPALIEQLDNEEYIVLYRAMQLIDGELYPPMAGKVAYKEGEKPSFGNPTPRKTWLQSDETPWNAVHARYDKETGSHKKGELKYDKDGNPVWVFKLDKGNGKALYAAYNPYIHTSASPLNDQFSEAQSRGNLVVVRVLVPKSELTSGYKADKAKDSVGMKQWHKGPISGVLAQYEGKGREVMLTRYAKIDRIVDWSEVADETIRLFEGTGLLNNPLPTNVFMPGLREELEKRGVEFIKTNNKGEIKDGPDKGKTWASVYGKDGLGKKPKAPKTPKRGKKGSDIRFSATPVDIEAVKGLQVFDAMNVGLEGEIDYVKESIAFNKSLIKKWERKGDDPLAAAGMKSAQHRLEVANRQLEILEDVQGQLYDVTRMEPMPSQDDTPQNIREYIAQMLTGGKRSGIMLTPETLEKELGWSGSDRNSFKYILSSKGMNIHELAELIVADAPEHVLRGMDSQDVRNEILEFLQSVHSYIAIRDYVASERAREAKVEADKYNADLDQFKEQFEAENGMTVEQYNELVIKQAQAAREMWLAEVENPEAFVNFEETKEDNNGETGNDQRAEAQEGVPADGGERAAAASESGLADDEDLPAGNDADQRAVGGSAADGGNAGAGDGRGEGSDKEPAVAPSDDELSRKTVEDIVNTGKQFVLEQNAEARNTFMERIFKINGDLSKLRRAASAQREYDKSTVNAIVDLANELLEKGALSNMTRWEIKRILSLIKSGVGRADLSVTVQRLMDIMIANQLRNAKARLAEFMKIKGKKVDSRGVEVQGKLDIAGQAMMDAMKLGMALSDEQLAQRIAETEDKLFDRSQTISKNAANDLAGLYLAQNYKENIAASEAEEALLRQGIKDAEEAYDEGEGTKEGLAQYKKSAYEAIRENRMERVNAYETLLDEMAGRVKDSIQKATALRDAEKERVGRIQHFANSDMQGMQESEHDPKPKAEWFWNSSVVGGLLSPLSTFDQWLRYLAPKSRDGKGYLWNHFMGGWTKATEKEYEGVRDAHAILDERARAIFGDEVKRWSDIFSIVRKLPKMDVKMWDVNGMKDFKLGQGNIMYIYMVNKMNDGKMKLRKMGILEEDVMKMAREIDPRLLYLADWLQESFLPSLREKYNSVHERMFGAPMAAIEDYFPLVLNQNARTREEEIGNANGPAKPSTITGSIIKRTKNSQALDLTKADALDVILDHIQKMEHWAAFAEWNRDLNTLISYKKFRNKILNSSGAMGAGEQAWKNFRTSAEIAAGVYQPAGKGTIDQAALNIVKGVTGAKISFRVYTALKQMLSWPAFISDTRADILAKNMVNPGKAWKWAMENLPLFEKRWLSRQAGDSRLMPTESDWKIWKTKVVEWAGRVGMTPNAFVDAVTVAIGAHAIYETMMKKYLDYGYTQEQAHEKAKLDATVLFNETQQSNEAAYLSQMQVDRTFMSTLLTIFRNSSMGYQRQYVTALRNIGRMMKKGYKEESIEYMKKQMMRDGLTEEQAKRAAEKIYNRSFTKNAVQALTFGFVVQFAWNLGPYMVYLLAGDDDDNKKEMMTDAALRALAGGVEGFAGGQTLSNLIGNLVARQEDWWNVTGIEMPAISDLESLMQLWGTEKYRALNDVFNLAVQAGVGVNPQTITDAIVAVVDACDGDLETSKEVMFALMRILQVPQSQIEALYIDEIDLKADEAYDMTVQEFAERYAGYKMRRNAPITLGLYSDEDAKKRESSYIKNFTKKVKEERKTRGSEEAQLWLNYMDTEYKEIQETLRELNRKEKEAYKTGGIKAESKVRKEIRAFEKTPEYKKYEQAKEVKSRLNDYKEEPKSRTERMLDKEWNKLMDMFNAPELKR